MLNYLEEHNSRELKTYFDSQIQPQLSTTTQLHHRHHVGNLEIKKKVQEQDYF